MSDIRARRDAVLKSSISIKAIGNSVTNFTKGLFKARSTASEIAQTTNENNKQPPTNNIQRAMYNEQHPTNNKQQTPNHKQQTKNNKLKTTNYKQ